MSRLGIVVVVLFGLAVLARLIFVLTKSRCILTGKYSPYEAPPDSRKEFVAAGLTRPRGICDRCPQEHEQNFGCVNFRRGQPSALRAQVAAEVES
jgi:hypothetical protein